MRDADRAEIIAQTGAHPAFALGATVGASDRAWTGLIDGQVACIFGVRAADEFDGTVGVPWMIGSDLLVTHQRLFLRHCRECVSWMQGMFPVLENHVDARNSVAINWLRWLGFDILEAEPHGPYGLPFYLFRRLRK